MTKILLLIIVVAIAIAWFRARSRQVGPPPVTPPQGTPAAQPLGERMVTCAQCGLNLPSSEAVFDAVGMAYCGAPHLEAQRARERR